MMITQRPLSDVIPSPLTEFGQNRRPGLIVGIVDELLRKGLVANLEESGFDVWATATAGESWDTYLGHTGDVDALLMDAEFLDIPADDFYRRLRAYFPGVPCYFLARSTVGAAATAAVQLGAPLLPWPTSLAALLRALKSAAMSNVDNDD